MTARSRAAGWLAVVVGLSVLAGAAPGAASAADNWPTYMHDLGRSGYNAGDSTITAGSVPSLAPKWTVRAPDTISTQAITANGLVYWGSWDGFEHATDPSTGADTWRTYLGDETKSDCSPPHLGVASSAAIANVKIAGHATSVLFVGGGDGAYYALNAKTGAIIWSHSFGATTDGYFSWSSPAVSNGSVYVGVSSIGDCPLVPGALVKLNAADGSEQASFAATAPGCPGAGVWTSPTVDRATGRVYITTGTDGGGICGQPEPYSQAMLALNGELILLGAWKVPQAEQAPDGDFGGTPTLFRATINGKVKQLVGAVNKNSVYYAFERTNVSAGPVWKTAPISSENDSLASTAWDGTRLYIAGHETVIEGTTCKSSIRAIDPATGAFVWSDCLTGGGADAAVSAIPGVAFESLGAILYGVASDTGQVLFQFLDSSYHWFYSPATVSNGALYIGNSDGNFYKFTPGGK